jgi:uncharacterized membrane protein
MAIWFFGFDLLFPADIIVALLIAVVAAVGAGLTAHVVGRLIRKKSAA